MSRPILLIFGSGKNVGAATIKTFLANKYRVAQATRSAKSEDSTDDVLQLPRDVTQPETVNAAFATLRKTWGEPNVVLFNAYSWHITDAKDTLASMGIEDFVSDITANVICAFVAAREAVASFKSLPSSASKTFLYTGNCLDEMKAMPGFLTLGAGKSAAAYMISEASESYRDQSFRFYYVDERTPEGDAKGETIRGPGHADFFLALAENKACQVPWKATFVERQGYQKFPKLE
ncbi:hypothetical protein CBER1_03887 [Cercospora berteroae]|uniref:NAD(P)-binding domain-containing protein n=1 Tax=Cercospora berteroae TaxID=357750 RepID=A0A2S6C9Z3_9PEZI|nr:hypothetical protein CBER1_03887 [Cercospora berteroae]